MSILYNTNSGGGDFQSKSVNPSTTQQVIKPDDNYDGLSQVTVNSAPLQSKTVTPSTTQQTITPDSGQYGLSSVVVEAIPTNFVKMASGILEYGPVNVNCGFQPTHVFLAYKNTSAGIYFDYKTPNFEQNMHQHTGTVRETKSNITITETGFTCIRNVGGDNGSPGYWVAIKA